MTSSLLVERWCAAGFLVFGLSHLVHAEKWVALFQPLRERETAGLLLGLFYLPLGLAVILMHPAWTWSPPVIVTCTGWALTVKSLVYLLIPGALQSLFRRCELQARSFRIAGSAMLLLGAALAWECY
jgi:hypothetical protein